MKNVTKQKLDEYRGWYIKVLLKGEKDYIIGKLLYNEDVDAYYLSGSNKSYITFNSSHVKELIELEEEECENNLDLVSGCATIEKYLEELRNSLKINYDSYYIGSQCEQIIRVAKLIEEGNFKRRK